MNYGTFQLYMNAARKGNVEAMHTVATMFRDGNGVDMDRSQADYWFEQAKLNGYNPDAASLMITSPSIDEEPPRRRIPKFFRVPKTKVGKAIYFTVLSAFTALVILVGCQAANNTPKITKPIETPIPNIDRSSELTNKIGNDVETVKGQAGKISTTVGDSAKVIEANATQGKIKTTEGKTYSGEELKTTFLPLWDAILREVGNLWSSSNEAAKIVTELEGTKASLASLQTELSTAKKNAEAAQKTYLTNLEAKDKVITKQAGQITDLKAELKDKTAALWRWMGVASGAVIAVAAVLFWVGVTPRSKQLAIALAIGGGVGLVLSLLIGQTMWMWPYILGAFVLIGAAWVIYDLFVKNKSIKELVQTGEAVKMYLPVEHRLSLFGNGPITGDADHIQSPSTKRVVAAVRPRVKKAPSQPPIPVIDGSLVLTSEGK